MEGAGARQSSRSSSSLLLSLLLSTYIHTLSFGWTGSFRKLPTYLIWRDRHRGGYGLTGWWWFGHRWYGRRWWWVCSFCCSVLLWQPPNSMSWPVRNVWTIIQIVRIGPVSENARPTKDGWVTIVASRARGVSWVHIIFSFFLLSWSESLCLSSFVLPWNISELC